MALRLPRIHHLIRYFVLVSILIFVGYLKQWSDNIFLLFIGPPMYLAYGLKRMIAVYLWALPVGIRLNQYLFVMPLTVLYFGFVGFQLKQLWNERGFIRTLSLFFFLAFLIYIHHLTWKNLLGYFTIPE